MNQLPQGWATAALADIIARDGIFGDGDWVESKDQDPDGSIRLLQLADVGDGVFLDKSNRFVNEATFDRLRCTEVVEGDILIARMPDPLGRACLAPKLAKRCITVVDVAIVRPGRASVQPAWLMRTLNAPEIRQEIAIQSSGTTRRRISRGNLSQLQLPVAPLNEQKRIADKLDAVLARVDACRERLDRVPVVLKRFRQSVLAAATSGNLTEDWRVENATDWDPTAISIGNLGEVVTGSTPTKKKSGNFGGSVPFYKPGELDAGYYVIDASEYLSDAGADQARLLPARTVMVTCIGATIGKTGLSRRAGATNQQINSVICNEAVALPEWLYFWCSSPTGQAAIIDNASATTLPILNKSRFSALTVEVPGITEQREIIRRVESLFAFADRLHERHASAHRRVHHLTPVLLSKAFRGELVPQDPRDEPARELLERIRAVRYASSGKPEKHGVGGKTKKKKKGEVTMIDRKSLQDQPHLSTILKQHGPLTAEALWSASQLEIDDFYDQLKNEEERGLLKEQRDGSSASPRLLEAGA